MSHKPYISLRWLLFLVLPLGGMLAAALIIVGGNNSDTSQSYSVAQYPSPPPVMFIPPTPQPTLRPTVPPAQESVIEGPVPDITLTTLDGGSVRLSDLNGQVIFLNFWATWCVPCQDEMPALQKLQNEHSTEGVRVIAVTDPTSGQTEDDIRAFLKTYDLTLTVALSSDAALYQQFGVEEIPITFIIDRGGIVRFRHIGALTVSDIAAYLTQLAS
jgi:peroxiredoxin